MSDSDSQSHDDCAAMGAPGEAHSRLEPFVGTFQGEVKIWMGYGEPMVSTGTMVSAFDLEGRFVSQTYTGHANDGPFPNFEGRGFWGYNTITNKYEGFWIDTASTVMQTDSGDVDDAGKVWTMIGEVPNPQTGQSMKKRSVITLQDNDHHSIEMYFETPDGEFKTMEITYTRGE